jgi:hypothetical protein
MILLLGLEHAFLLSLGMFSPGLKARGRDKRARHHRVAATEQTKFMVTKTKQKQNEIYHMDFCLCRLIRNFIACPLYRKTFTFFIFVCLSSVLLKYRLCY